MLGFHNLVPSMEKLPKNESLTFPFVHLRSFWATQRLKCRCKGTTMNVHELCICLRGNKPVDVFLCVPKCQRCTVAVGCCVGSSNQRIEWVGSSCVQWISLLLAVHVGALADKVDKWKLDGNMQMLPFYQLSAFALILFLTVHKTKRVLGTKLKFQKRKPCSSRRRVYLEVSFLSRESPFLPSEKVSAGGSHSARGTPAFTSVALAKTPSAF